MGVGAAIAGLFSLTTTTAAIVALAIDIGLTILANSIFSPKPRRGAGERLGRTGNVKTSDFPHQVVYGRCRKGGMVFYLNGTGEDNVRLHMGVVLAAHECESIDEWYVNGEATPLDGSGFPTGNLKQYARFQYALGADDQAALPDMVSENSNWTNDHRARGNCYFYSRLVFDAEVFPSFIPSITVRMRGHNDVHDPRGTPTDAWTDNPALICADILERYLGVPASRIDTASLIAAADVCDEAVALADGSSEKRYRAGGFFELEGDPESWLIPWIAAMGGYVGEFGGVYYIHAGAWRAPEVTVTEDDLRGGVKYRTSESVFSRSNGAKGTFASAQSFDQPAEFPPLVNATYVAEDNGVEQMLEVDLEMVPSHSQAQRLSKIYLEENRRDEMVELVVSLEKGLDVKPWDTITLDLETIGIAGTWRIAEHKLEAAGDEESAEVVVRLVLKRHDAAVYDWDETTEEQPYDPATTNLPGAESCQPQSPAATLNTNSSHADHQPATVDFTWTDPDCKGVVTASDTGHTPVGESGAVLGATNGPATINLGGAFTAGTAQYLGLTVKILTGPGAGEEKTLTGVAGGGNNFTVDSDWTVVPTASSTYELGQAHMWMPGRDSGDLVGNYIELLSTAAAGQIREIVAFDADDVAEMDRDFDPYPDSPTDWEVAPRTYEIEVQVSLDYEYRVTGSGDPWTPASHTETVTAIGPGFQEQTVEVENEAITDPSGFDFQNHVVTTARVRAKLDSGTWSPWVDAEVS